MKIKTIILTAITACSLVIKGQNLGGLINSAKDAVKSNSTAIIDAAETNSATVIDKANTIVKGSPSAPSLTNDEVVKGLKEALTVGKEVCESVAVSPWPGKCFPVEKTP